MRRPPGPNCCRYSASSTGRSGSGMRSPMRFIPPTWSSLYARCVAQSTSVGSSSRRRSTMTRSRSDTREPSRSSSRLRGVLSGSTSVADAPGEAVIRHAPLPSHPAPGGTGPERPVVPAAPGQRHPHRPGPDRLNDGTALARPGTAVPDCCGHDPDAHRSLVDDPVQIMGIGGPAQAGVNCSSKGVAISGRGDAGYGTSEDLKSWDIPLSTTARPALVQLRD